MFSYVTWIYTVCFDLIQFTLSFPSFSRCTCLSGPAPGFPPHNAFLQQSSPCGTGSKHSVPAAHISVSSKTSCAPVRWGQHPSLALQPHSLTSQKRCVLVSNLFWTLVMFRNFCSFIWLQLISNDIIQAAEDTKGHVRADIFLVHFIVMSLQQQIVLYFYLFECTMLKFCMFLCLHYGPNWTFVLFVIKLLVQSSIQNVSFIYKKSFIKKKMG